MPSTLARALHAAHVTVLRKRFNTRCHLLHLPLFSRRELAWSGRVMVSERLAFAVIPGTVLPSLAVDSVASEPLKQTPLASACA